MTPIRKIAFFLLLSALVGVSAHGAEDELDIAVIGGLDMSGVWSRMEQAAEHALGFQINTTMTAPREQVVPAFINGDADVLLIHGGDETFALESLGFAAPLSTWGYNEFVIAGPMADPAKIVGAASGVEAILKIQAADQPIIQFRDVGSHQILRRLTDNAGLSPTQLRLIPDSADQAQQILVQAARDQAYVIVGHMPIAFGRMAAPGIDVLFSGDSGMRRAYVIVTPGPKHPANSETRAAADKLVAYFLSEAGQTMVESAGKSDGQTWIYPRNSAAGLLEFKPDTVGGGNTARRNRQ